jgi:hypothetical protein
MKREHILTALGLTFLAFMATIVVLIVVMWLPAIVGIVWP